MSTVTDAKCEIDEQRMKTNDNEALKGWKWRTEYNI